MIPAVVFYVLYQICEGKDLLSWIDKGFQGYWFLIVLFEVFVVYYMVCMISQLSGGKFFVIILAVVTTVLVFATFVLPFSVRTRNVFSIVNFTAYMPFFAIGVISKVQDNLNVPYFEEQAIHILHICEGGIRKFGGKISLYHINSVLHFLIGINRMRKCMEKANVVCKLLPDILRRILKQKWYTPADCLIFEQLKQEAEKYHPELWYEIQSICFPQTNGPIKNMEQYIRIAWLQELYFGKVIIPLPTTEEIGTFIDRKQQKITLDGFLLQNGLAGLGCMLLPTNQQTTLNHITNL